MAKKLNKKPVIESWADWFCMCDDLIKPVKEYENCMHDYMELVYEEEDVFAEYHRRHNTGFYKQNSLFPSWRIKSVIKPAVFGLIIGYLFGFVLNLITTSASDVVGSLVFAIGFGILGLVLGGGGYVGLYIAKIKQKTSKLTKMENILEPYMKFIPNKYRNSLCLECIFNSYGNVGSSLQLTDVINYMEDTWFPTISLSDMQTKSLYPAKTMSIMFDETYTPLSNTGAEYKPEKGKYEVNMDSPVMQNEDLPKDIVEKTFAGAEDADKQLNSLIGMDRVKRQVRKMRSVMRFQEDGGGTSDFSTQHMCFLGSAGVGKTVTARILTKMLYDYGYIKENKCVEVEGSYFKSPYSGKTTARTNAIIDYALGGVLFIDEAYSMLDNSSAGADATTALLKRMEDDKKNFVVILAGYEDAVNRLIASNEGFASRIKDKIYFDDYTLDELMKIFDLYLRTAFTGTTYTISNDASKLLREQLGREKDAPMFGNARTVRNALAKIFDIHADNYAQHKLNEGDKLNFVYEDVEQYVNERKEELAQDTRNYMASQGIDESVVKISDLKSNTKGGSIDPDKDLNNLIGLGMLRDEIKKWKAQFDFYDGTMGENEGHHMCFVGNPGTGKSTVAKIMTGYLYKMGIIQRNEFMDVNGGFLKGDHVGFTEKRVNAIIQYAQGGVLFIDEAYSLCNGDSVDSFAQAAIDLLVDKMEKQRKNFVVILAGYEKEMGKFLQVNSGLPSRITHTFHFPDYSVHELAQIIQIYAKRDKFSVETEAWRPIQLHIKAAKENTNTFGNARFARSYWEELKKAHILNVSEGKYDEKDKFVIKNEDVIGVEKHA